MRSSRDLRKLQSTGQKRVARLRSVADTVFAPSAEEGEAERAIAYCCIELHNFWSGFSRSLYLSVVLGARDRSGDKVVCTKLGTVATLGDALWPAVKRCRRGKSPKETWSWSDEPRWFETSSLLDALDEVGAANYSLVSAGLSGPASGVFDSLGVFRNFFCHRNKSTAELVAVESIKFGVAPSTRPSVVLRRHARTPEGTRPQPLLLDWIDEVRDAVELCI